MKRSLSFLLAFIIFLCASSSVGVDVYADNAANLAAHQITNKIIQDYVEPDFHLDKYDLTESEEAELLAVAEGATADCTTDYEKISAITKFVAEEIYYDYDYYYGRTTTLYYKPYEVWTNKRTVCEGYARLTKELFNLLNIPCMCIYADNHAYNGAYDADNDRWIYLDSTWCSGNTYSYEQFKSGSYRPSRFDMSLETLASLDNHEVYDISGIVVNDIEYKLETPETVADWANLDEWKVCATGVADDFDSTVIDIIGSLEGIAVKTINGAAFDGCSTVTTVKMPDSLLEIKYRAFRNCTSLTSVTFPDNLTNIENTVFSGCTSLTSITIPDSVTEVRNSVFEGCVNLTSVTLPKNISFIGSSIFQDCTSLTSITIPTSVTRIGDSAFRGCTGLTSITIPQNVTKIDSSAFRGCTNLTSVVIPDSVIDIGSYAFRDCTNLACIKLPENMTTINSYTFCNCSSLTEITIPDGVTTIGDYAFNGCTGFTSVTIPDSVTKLGSSVFRDCVNLASVTFPDKLSSLGSYALRGCTSLTSVTLPDGLPSIPIGCFYNCKNLTSVIIPDGITTIDIYAFYQCYNLSSITIPDSVTSIEYCAFAMCTYLSTVTIPDGVVSIGDKAFHSCVRLSSVSIPDSVQTIGDYAFRYCDLRFVVIPKNVTTLGDYVFQGCSGLKKVVMYDNLTEIGVEAVTSPKVIYCYENTTAHSYAVENGISYVPIQLSSERNEVSVDFNNRIIFSSVNGCTDVAELVSTSQGCDLSANASLTEGDIKCYGTGSEVVIAISGVPIDEYIIVVEGDTNRDGVCDVLDVSETELIANGHKNSVTLQCYAANGCVADSIDASAYQNVVNTALNC